MPASLDEAKLHAFVGKMLGDLGGAMSVPTVRLGFRLGLFDALAEGPATAPELARRAGGLHERYVREWALAQTANGYVDFDPATDTFSQSPEQALVFQHRDSPVYLAGAFELVAAMIEAEAKVEECFRNGRGVRWGDHAGCLFCATGAFFRPGYVNNIVQSWIPALDGVEAKLRRGAKVADVGCGVGFSTLLMAQAYPDSAFVGYDFHAPSIDEARRHAVAHGLQDPRAGRELDDRRADRRRPAGAEPQPGRAALLQCLDDDLRADLARSGGGRRAWRAGGRGAARGDHPRRRVRRGAQGDRRAVQYGAGGAVSVVIPAQAGIHSGWPCGSFDDLREWIPAFAGMTVYSR